MRLAWCLIAVGVVLVARWYWRANEPEPTAADRNPMVRDRHEMEGE